MVDFHPARLLAIASIPFANAFAHVGDGAKSATTLQAGPLDSLIDNLQTFAPQSASRFSARLESW
jgi:hypothetical protein